MAEVSASISVTTNAAPSLRGHPDGLLQALGSPHLVPFSQPLHLPVSFVWQIVYTLEIFVDILD